MNDIHRNDIHKTDPRARINMIAHRVLDAVDAVLATLARAPEERRASVAVERRQAANFLGLWQFCAERTCRRARCCRGEPSQCLRTTLPLVSPDLLAGLIKRRQRRRTSRSIRLRTEARLPPSAAP